jgi:hypothetical protein
MPYRTVKLADGTSVDIPVKRLRTVTRAQSSHTGYKVRNGRKSLFGTHIPTVRKKSERKSRAHNDSGLDTNLERRVVRVNYDRKHSPIDNSIIRKHVSIRDLNQLAMWTGKRVGFMPKSVRSKQFAQHDADGISVFQQGMWQDYFVDSN